MTTEPTLGLRQTQLVEAIIHRLDSPWPMGEYDYLALTWLAETLNLAPVVTSTSNVEGPLALEAGGECKEARRMGLDLATVSTDDLVAELARRGNQLGRCSCRKWPLYVGAYDRHGTALRCRGCLRIPEECTCR